MDRRAYPQGRDGGRRYYQDAAIRAVFEALASGLLRVLLSLATGAGKTFIAVNLLKRIADAGLLRKALFVCDRDELRNQALAAFKNHFGSDVAEVYQTADGKNHARNARIHIATYQTLDSDHGKEAVRAVTTACLLETGFTEAGVKDALMMEADVADAMIEPGEILIARSNTPALVGRAALFEGSDQRLVASDLTIRLRCRDGLEPGFAAAWFSYQFVTGYWRERASGASDTMKKIGRAQLASTDIPIPAIKTQRRIAARLREQFEHLQQLKAALSDQLAALDRHPGAYLREAFGGLQ